MCFSAEHGPALCCQLLEICFGSTQSSEVKSWLLQSEKISARLDFTLSPAFFKIFLHTFAMCTVIFTLSVEINWWQYFQHLFILLIADVRAATSTKQPIKPFCLVYLVAVEGENTSALA